MKSKFMKDRRWGFGGAVYALKRKTGNKIHYFPPCFYGLLFPSVFPSCYPKTDQKRASQSAIRDFWSLWLT